MCVWQLFGCIIKIQYPAKCQDVFIQDFSCGGILKSRWSPIDFTWRTRRKILRRVEFFKSLSLQRATPFTHNKPYLDRNIIIIVFSQNKFLNWQWSPVCSKILSLVIHSQRYLGSWRACGRGRLARSRPPHPAWYRWSPAGGSTKGMCYHERRWRRVDVAQPSSVPPVPLCSREQQ